VDIVDAALRKARELELRPPTVTVLDPGGHALVVKREDGAGILRPQIAHAKAWGCLGTGAGEFSVPASVAASAAQVDAIVSSASIGQAEGTPDSFTKDRDAVAVMTKALGDSGKPLIFTSGSAIFGVFTKGEASPPIFDEDHPVPLLASVFAPPEAEVPPPFIEAFGGAMAARAETEATVLKAVGVRGIEIRPGLVYGDGKGYDLPNLIALAKKYRAAPHLGAGRVRQGYVHIDDLVGLYVLALERAPAGAILHAVTGEIALGDLAAAVSRLVRAAGRTEALSLMEVYARGGGGGACQSISVSPARGPARPWAGFRPDTTYWKIRSTALTPRESSARGVGCPVGAHQLKKAVCERVTTPQFSAPLCVFRPLLGTTWKRGYTSPMGMARTQPS
jgi:nucleoside-diphosphate-sugar epimerase